MTIIEHAIQIAKAAHHGQTRKYAYNGVEVPYFTHPERIAKRLSQLFDITPNPPKDVAISAAYLHDVIEDCPQRFQDEIIERCGIDVFLLVLELTNPSKGLKLKRALRKQVDRAHLKHASLSAKLIKLIDRTDNLREMISAPDDFKELYLEESLALLNEGIGRGTTSQELEQEYTDAMDALRQTLEKQ